MAHYGGDEFIFLLPTADRENVLEVIERIQQILTTTPATYENNTMQLRASFGIARYKPEDKNLDDMLKRADKAMYHAKRTGGHSCKLAD